MSTLSSLIFVYHPIINHLLMDVDPAERSTRLRELRGTTTLRTIADRVGVTPQAVQKWERSGQVGRSNAEAYDEALGAGGEVLSMLGYADTLSGVTLTTIDTKLDELLVLVRDLHDRRPARRRTEGDGTPTAMPRPALKSRAG